MQIIWKFPLGSSDEPVKSLAAIEMPDGSRILSLAVQNGVPCLWAIIDEQRPLVERVFMTIGTGHKVPDKIMLTGYIGTYLLPAKQFVVGHVFEVGA